MDVASASPSSPTSAHPLSKNTVDGANTTTNEAASGGSPQEYNNHNNNDNSTTSSSGLDALVAAALKPAREDYSKQYPNHVQESHHSHRSHQSHSPPTHYHTYQNHGPSQRNEEDPDRSSPSGSRSLSEGPYYSSTGSPSRFSHPSQEQTPKVRHDRLKCCGESMFSLPDAYLHLVIFFYALNSPCRDQPCRYPRCWVSPLIGGSSRRLAFWRTACSIVFSRRHDNAVR